MKKETKHNLSTALIASFLVIAFLSIFNCSRRDDVVQNDIKEKISSIQEDDQPMNPGPDPELLLNSDDSYLRTTQPTAVYPTWTRMMYVDKTDTFYSNTNGRQAFANFLQKYGFTGVYLYSTSGIISSSSNYTRFGDFLKTLSDKGVTSRAVASGGSSTFQTSGNVSRFNSSQSDPSRRINVANLELEWWRGATSWATWNTTNQQISFGTIPTNDFYEGWYKNLGTTVDSVAAYDQVRYSDRILLHCYQLGIPTYSYANAQSSGATSGRLDLIAKGARRANKKIDLYFILSAENTAWGADYTFTGPALAQAYSMGAPNPFLYIEQRAYDNIVTRMTTFQKQWINFKGFVWFTKRYCYAAVPR